MVHTVPALFVWLVLSGCHKNAPGRSSTSSSNIKLEQSTFTQISVPALFVWLVLSVAATKMPQEDQALVAAT
jgi:hypothetical protein